MIRPRLLALGLVLLAVLGAWPPSPAAAQDADQAAPGRVLVVSVPGLTWADVKAHDLPTLEAFFAGAALADMAPRGVSPRSGPGDAYLTISAGSRSTTQRSVDGQVLAVGEQSSGSLAGEIFARRTGLVPEGQFVSLAWPALERANASKPYDAVLGLLAETLVDAGVPIAAVGNADGTDSVGPSFERQVGLALADSDGVVRAGALEEGLLLVDPAWPFGRRLDHDEVERAVQAHWPDDGSRRVTLVEASDLARTLRYRPMVDSARYRRLWAEALADTDALLARLLARVDPSRDLVIVVAPYNLPGDRDLTAFAMAGPGVEPGYLRSASTQRSGFLTLVDVAPTILARLGLDRPVEMEGRPATVTASGASLDHRVDHLISLNAASRFRERLLVPTTTFEVVGLTLLAAVTVVLLTAGWMARWRHLVAFSALTLLAVLPASYLARGFPLEDLGAGFYWAFILVFGLVAAAAATLAARAAGRPRLALVLVLALMALVLCGDVMTGSRLSLSAAFGYSPTGNSRLYGISNYSYGQLVVPACVLAAFLLGSRPEPWRRRAALVLMLAALVVLGVPKWGSDVGGVLAFTPAIGAFVVAVYRWRLRLRTLVVAGVATAGAIAAFGFLDLARPPEERAHLGRLFERVGDEGVGPLLSIMRRKLVANLQVSTSSLWVAAIPVALAFWAFVVRSPLRPLDGLRRRTPALGAGLVAVVVAAVLGSAVNDSGAIVGGVAAMVITTTLVWLCVEPERVEAGP